VVNKGAPMSVRNATETCVSSGSLCLDSFLAALPMPVDCRTPRVPLALSDELYAPRERKETHSSTTRVQARVNEVQQPTNITAGLVRSVLALAVHVQLSRLPRDALKNQVTRWLG
jgi:hypothetical protein